MLVSPNGDKDAWVAAELVEQDMAVTRETFEATKARLLAARKLVASELADIDAGLRRVDRVLRATELDKPKSTKKQASKLKSVSEEVVLEVYERIKASHEALGVPQLAADLSTHETGIRAAIAVLRDRDLIRLVGAKKQPGRKGIPPRLYTATEGFSNA